MEEKLKIYGKLKTLPNKLTLGRMAVIPVLLLLYPFAENLVFLRIFCAIVFALAAATDFLDGYLARRYDNVTRLGAILDPMADKILITAAIVLLAHSGLIPAILAGLLLCREIGVSGLRLAARDQNITVSVNNFGKVKTVLQDVSVFLLLINTPSLRTPGMIGLWAALIVSWYSAWLYWQAFWQASNKDEISEEDTNPGPSAEL